MTDETRYGAQRTLEIGAIERELQLLWKDAADSSTKSGAGAVTRACSMTLVAACSNDVQFEQVAKIVERTAARHPGRAILARIRLEESAPGLEAQVSAVCSAAGAERRQVCHEQIEISASGSGIDALAPAILSLLVPDVPAYVWIPCERVLGLPFAEDLVASADALLIDSHRYAAPFLALARASAISRGHRADRAAGFGIHDLEWIRLAPWLAATAAAFDRPEDRAILPKLSEVRIACAQTAAGGERERVSAALFAGWLASCLGWAPGAKPIRITPRAATDRPGSLLEVELKSPEATVRITRPAGSSLGAIKTERRGGACRDESASFPACEDAEALSGAICRAPRDAAFEAALPIALSLAPH